MPTSLPPNSFPDPTILAREPVITGLAAAPGATIGHLADSGVTLPHHIVIVGGGAGGLTGLDRAAREILLEPVHDASGAEIVPAQRIGYDTLVIAVGSMLNDFGVPGVAEHCLFLDSLAHAERIQQIVLRRFLRGHSEARTATLPRLRVAIVGAGATGVEFAAELRHAGRRLTGYRLRGFERDESLEVRLIEAAPSVLPALPERVQEATAHQLQALNIEVHTGQQARE